MKNIKKTNSNYDVSFILAIVLCSMLLISMFITSNQPQRTFDSEDVYQNSQDYEQIESETVHQLMHADDEDNILTIMRDIPEEETEEPTSGSEDEIREIVSETAPAEIIYGEDAITYKIPYYSTYQGFKSYERYTSITCTTSPHYRLQHEYAYTNELGFRMVNGRYCVAMGTYFGLSIGQYFTIRLANGTEIPCILGDVKADCHTDSMNIFTVYANCCSEFIIDYDVLPTYVRNVRGDVSYICNEWQSPVVEVIVYNYNVMS